MHRDLTRHYSELGISENATLDEIRAVYRGLAKIYHPDKTDDPIAIEKFRRIAEAYEVLSRSVRQSSSDHRDEGTADAAKPLRTKTNSPQYERDFVSEVCCSLCKRSTAQPRVLSFRYVVSFVVYTRITSKTGIYCSKCAADAAFKASVFSGMFGWWGIPFGPIATVFSILGNVAGGHRDRETEAIYLWQNALSFFLQKRFDLSAALAYEVWGTRNEIISKHARILLDDLAHLGFQPRSLNSAWKISVRAALGQIAVMLAAPIVVALFTVSGSHTAAFSISLTQQASQGAVSERLQQNEKSPVTETEITKKITETPGDSPINEEERVQPSNASVPNNTPRSSETWHQEIDADLCLTHPKNSQVVKGFLPITQYGHRLTVINGSASDAIVKIRDAATGHLVIAFYSKEDETAVLNAIPDGNYKVQFAFGGALNVGCNQFLEPLPSEFPDVLVLTTDYTESQAILQSVTFTLHSVPSGNVHPQAISAADFDRE